MRLKNSFPFPAPISQEVEAFHLAAGKGEMDAVAVFVEKHPSFINEKGASNDAALLYAARNGRAEVVKLLLQKGADIDIRNHLGWSALMMASWWGRTAIMTLLLDGGAPINAQSQSGLTPLMLAANMGRTNAVILLLKRGAAIDRIDDSKRTALMMARERGYHEPANVIEQWKLAEGREAALRLERLRTLRPSQSPFKKGGPHDR
jgi:ankyrin repeat protein